jgi:hypothetical protein
VPDGTAGERPAAADAALLGIAADRIAGDAVIGLQIVTVDHPPSRPCIIGFSQKT